MTNDGKRAYVANLLDHTIRCLSIDGAPACPTPGVASPTPTQSTCGSTTTRSAVSRTALRPVSIQLPISPDDHYMLVVGTFTGNVLQIDMRTNTIAHSFPAVRAATASTSGPRRAAATSATSR